MKICEVCGTVEGRIYGATRFGKSLCVKHYHQMRSNGKILERTIFDRNEIVNHKDFSEIILLNKDGSEKARVIIDNEDISKVKDYKWYLAATGYPQYGNSSKAILMHRLIMGFPIGMQIDHISRNKLDNRKSNLRICTNQENSFNKGLQSNNTSGYTGVYWVKAKKMWAAVIMVSQKKIQLGYYIDFDDAVRTRKSAEIKYFGEFKNTEVQYAG